MENIIENLKESIDNAIKENFQFFKDNKNNILNAEFNNMTVLDHIKNKVKKVLPKSSIGVIEFVRVNHMYFKKVTGEFEDKPIIDILRNQMYLYLVDYCDNRFIGQVHGILHKIEILKDLEKRGIPCEYFNNN